MTILLRLLEKVRKMEYGFIAILSLIVIAIGSFGIVLLEPENFPSFFEGFWWTMTTLTTVGYGDYYPTTVAGRLLGIFLFIFGIGLIGLLISKTVDSIVTYHGLKREGKLMFKGNHHFIYIGWSTKTSQAIQEVLAHIPQAKIVLIDDLSTSPIELEQVHYIQGNPSDDETLLKANIIECNRVAIFSDPKIENPLLADGKTLLIASAVEALAKKNNQDIHTIVEINEDRHIQKFKHIAVDDFILSNDSVSLLMAKATLEPGTTNIFRQLLSKQFGNNIHILSPNKDWKTYKQASENLLEMGAVLLAVNEDMDFSNAANKPINPTDKLFIVCHDDTYLKIKSSN